MSLDIDWNKLDSTLATHVQHFLNRQFQNITKPSFIGNIEVTAFDWGTETPQIEITNITDPFPEFYEPEEQQEHEEVNSNSKQDKTTSTIASSSSSSSMDNGTISSQHQSEYNTTRLSLNTPLSQQQRFNFMHSFHRSPFVGPQHPFINTPINHAPNTFSDDGSSNNSDHWNSMLEPHHEDWIDDEDIIHTNHSSSQHTTTTNTNTNTKDKSTEMDFQIHMLISYKGDMSMTVMTELRMNYPSVMFMSLPINLRVRSVEFEATAVVAYIQSMNRVCVSMLEPEIEGSSTRLKDSTGMDRYSNKQIILPSSPSNPFFIYISFIYYKSLLRNVHIETIVGDEQKQVLKNVGKIEKFIVDQLRKMLDDELVFPSYQLIQLFNKPE